MSEDREAEILAELSSRKHSATSIALRELLQIRRERYRDKLERQESEQVRGRSLECKNLLEIFS